MRVVHYNLQREDNLSIKGKMAGPNMSIIQRFHCKQNREQNGRVDSLSGRGWSCGAAS